MATTGVQNAIHDDINDLNFSFLESTYGSTLQVRRGRNLLNRGLHKQGVDLSDLLRHHNVRPVFVEEVEHRNAVDEVISYYSVLEIAALIGYIHLDPQNKNMKEAARNLLHPAVRRYYAESYPLTLPKGFRLRIESKLAPVENGAPADVFPLFVQFLSISEDMNQDDEISAFLWLLDSGLDSSGMGLYDFKEILEDKKKLFQVITKRKTNNQQYKELRGYAKFITFSIEFDTFLKSLERFPLFKSACYQYHCYWYLRFGKKLDVLSERINEMLSELRLNDRRLVRREEKVKLVNNTFRESISRFEFDRDAGKVAIKNLTEGSYGNMYASAIRV